MSMSEAARAIRPVRRLSSLVVDQIAAGEVVERPANIVKELVENALDAGATRVRVDIEEGGIGLVRVSDDGHGMTPENAALALERHATSKLSVFEDLATLASFGFRGEALPSIASVSRFKLWTRTASGAEGTLVCVCGAERRVEPAGAAVGTTVEVRDLFFNVPARRKFLKSTATEAAHVADVVLSMALCRPDVTFVLTRDGRTQRELLACPATEERRAARVAQAFPKAALQPVSGARAGLAFDAWLSSADEARTGSSALYLVVNGRAVRDARLARAVATAYGEALETGRYPAGAVFIDVPPADVDVNAHPQKTEVRFRDPRAVFELLASEIARSYGYGGATSVPLTSRSPASLVPQAPWSSQPRMTKTWTASEPPAPHVASAPSFDMGSLYASGESAPSPAAAPSAPGAVASPRADAGGSFFVRLRPLALVRGELCVCESDDGIYVIDGHAAWERVVFSALCRGEAPSWTTVRAPADHAAQAPHVEHVDPALADAVEHRAEALRARGFIAERSGARHVSLSAVPAAVAAVSRSEVLAVLSGEIASSSASGAAPSGLGEDAWQRIYAALACRAAHAAMTNASLARVQEALVALGSVTFAGRCTHDRPVANRMGFDEVDRRLGL